MVGLLLRGYRAVKLVMSLIGMARQVSDAELERLRERITAARQRQRRSPLADRLDRALGKTDRKPDRED